MNAPDPGKIAIQAIKRPVSERPALIESACGGDVTLRERVEELIKIYEDSGEFSAESSGATGRARANAREGPGTRIGRYKLLQQIGEGGFGVVYMAEQHKPVRRKVALKVVKPGMDTKEVLARFEAERQALALMDHPNIARVLDAGTTGEERPFFVMDLVRGVSITEYCDKNNLGTRGRLELFSTVCRAVQHAHQKGIIHRDLKPSNILVTLHDGKPVPKVIDFGVAKALHQQLTQRTLFTAYGQVVGTPQYMSPEQAEMSGLDVDTRSDIYSLGVLLYELLTGSTPLDGRRLQSAGFAEMLRIIREEEPPKPSTRVSTAGDEATVVAKHRSADPRKLSQQLRGELDWIVMKALDKDRNRRYETANGFAADLQRYLHDEPILACPPSAAYRVRKFARRNKKLVAAAGAIGAVLLVGAVLSAVMALRAVDAAQVAAKRLASETEARADAEHARQAETEQRKAAEIERDRALDAQRQATRQRNLALASEQKAQANFQQARDTVDRYLTTVSESQLLTVPGMQPLRGKLLDSALTFYEHFVAARQNNVPLRAGLGAAYLRLGEVQSDLREEEMAKTYYAKAQGAFEALVREGHDTPNTLRQLGQVYFWQGRYTETVALCKRALEKQPDQHDAQLLLANTYNTLALDATNQDEATQIEALRIHRDALTIRSRLVELDPTNPKYLGDLSSTVNNIGVVLGSRRKATQALDMFRLARRYGDAAFARAPYSMLYGRFAAIMRRNVAINAARMSFEEETLGAYEAVVDAWNLLAINNPAITSYKSERYQAYQQLAGYQQRIGQQDEAAATLRLARQSVENLPQETAEDLYGLAKVYAALARSRGPEQEAMGKLAVLSLARAAVMGYGDISVIEEEPALAEIRKREDCQRLLAVLKLEQEILQVYEDPEKREDVARIRKDLEQHGKDDVARISVARTLRKIAEFYERTKEFDESRMLLDRALSLLDKNTDGGHAAIDALFIRCDLGRLDWVEREYAKAHRLWQTCLAELGQLAETHRDDRNMQQQLSVEERKIYQHYGRVGLFPLFREYAARSVEFRRVWAADLATLPSDGELSAVLLVADDGGLRHGFFQQLAESLRNGGYALQFEPVHLVRGIAAMGDSELLSEEMLAHARKVYDDQPDNGWVAVAMAMVDYHHGHYVEAQAVLERFRASNDAQVAFLDAAVAAKLGDHTRAQQRWNAAQSQYARNCRDALSREVENNNNGLLDRHWWQFAYGQAMRQIAAKALTGKPAPEDPWQHLIQARGYQLIGEVEKATVELAAAAAPTNLGVLLARANLYRELGKYEESIADASRAAELDSHNPVPWIVRGQCHAERGEQQKASADFAEAASRFENLSEKDQLQITDRLLECGKAVVLALPDRHDAPYRTLITRNDLTRTLSHASRTKDAQQTLYQTLAVRQLKAQPNIIDPAWQLTRVVFLRGCQAAHYNPRDGRLYVGTRDTGSDGLYAIDAGGRITRIADADGVGAVAVDPEEGHIFVAEDRVGQIYRTAFGTTGREIWVSEFKPTDSDPHGMAFATEGYKGDLLAPGDGVVVDLGWYHAPDEIYRFSAAGCEEEVLLHTDGENQGPLVAPLDVTVGSSGIFIADKGEKSEGGIYRLSDDGSPTLVSTNVPIERPVGIASDPITGDLFVADIGGKQLLRVDPKTGATRQILSGLSIGVHSAACVDVTPDGRQVFITDRDSNAIFTFAVRTAEDFAKAIKDDPDDPVHWIKRARFHAFHGDRKQALADLNKAAEIGPDDSESDDPIPWIQRGRFYAKLGQGEKADADFAKAASLTPHELNKFLEAGWWVVGPYPRELDEFCPPEIDPDPSKPVYTVHPKTGLSDEPARWRMVPSDSTGRIALRDAFAPQGNSSVYLLAYVYSPDERTATLRTNQTAAFRIWVNGEASSTVEPKFSGGFLARKFYFTPLVLRPGRNTILVKLQVSPKAKELSLRLSDHPLERAFDLARSGLLDEAADVVAEEYAQTPSADWHWLEIKYPLTTLRHPRTCRAIARDALATSVGHRLVDVCLGLRRSDSSPDVDLLSEVAAEFDTVESLSKTPWVRGHLGLIYVRLQRWQDALAVLGNGQPLKAIAHHLRGDQKAAKAVLDRALVNLQSTVDAARIKQDGHHLSHSFAIQHIRAREACALIEGNTDRVDAFYHEFQQICRKRWEARNSATVVFDDVVAIAPDKPQAYLARGKRLAQLGRLDDAAADFDKAVELAPADPNVLTARAEFHADRGDVENTVDDFNAALDAIPARNRYGQSSWVYLAATRDDAIFNRLSILRNDEYVQLYKVIHYLHQHEIPKAKSIVLGWLGAQGNNSPADQCCWTAALVLCGDIEEFERRRKNIQAIQFKNNSSHHGEYVKAMTLGLAPTSEEMSVELLKTAERLLAKAPKLKKRFASTLGLAQLRAGMLDEAVETLESGVDLTPGQKSPLSEVWPLLAIAHHLRGDSAEASAYLRKTERLLERHQSAYDSGTYATFEIPRGHTRFWLFSTVFYREAKQLIKQSSKTATKGNGIEKTP